MARRGDTKPLCQRAQAGVAYIGASLLPLSDGKTLVLCLAWSSCGGSTAWSTPCGHRARQGLPAVRPLPSHAEGLPLSQGPQRSRIPEDVMSLTHRRPPDG